MNLRSVQFLVENCNDHQLQQAEMDLLEGTTSRPDIPGSTAEEQLTHVLGALWVVQHMKATDDSIADALREFAKRVRNSTERT